MQFLAASHDVAQREYDLIAHVVASKEKDLDRVVHMPTFVRGVLVDTEANSRSEIALEIRLGGDKV